MEKLLIIQPHSDDALFSMCHALVQPELYDVEVLTVETEPKRAEEDRRLFDFLEIPVTHLGVEFKDESYYVHFKEKGYKNVTHDNAYDSVTSHLDAGLLSELEFELRGQISAKKREGRTIVSPLGVGHPFHYWVKDKIERAFGIFQMYREFPHSYKRRNQGQMIDIQANPEYQLNRLVPVAEFDDVKWELAKRFYKSQSGLLFYESGYIKKQLDEEVWDNDTLPF